MNKDDVYKLIGYQGEYNASVKKAIRKLLKENHPDNKGNRDKFELINKVKEELENNKVSSKYHKKTSEKAKTYDDIDYSFCHEQINLLTKKKELYLKDYDQYNSELSILKEEYPKLYRKSMDLELNLLSSSKEAKKIKNIKIISIVMVIFISLFFVISIIKQNIIYLIIFALLTIVCVIFVERYFVLVNEMTINNKKRLKEYVLINKSIHENTSKQDELKDKILIISKNINTVENDLRFYNNLLK